MENNYPISIIHYPLSTTTINCFSLTLGNYIHFISALTPEEIDYTQYGIDNAIIIDNTGTWRDREGLSRHLNSKGVAKVLLTAPGKDDIPNIVHGVNHENFDVNTENIWSAASCTTNAIFDSPATIISRDGMSVVLYVWYDNEYGYTRQMIRFCKQLAGVIRLHYY